MWPYQHAWGFGIFYGLVWLALVVIVVSALWRGMRAHETIAKQLEVIARSLQAREQK
jgi:hypothetical protein